MLVKVNAAALCGIDAQEVTLEVLTEPGVGTTMVGMPDASVRESYDRVDSAITQSGYPFPRCRVVINFAPADVRKEGPAFDLPLALGLLAADGKMQAGRLPGFLIMGQLSLDGTVLPIKGVLPMAIMARRLGYKGMIVPAQNAREGAVVNNLEVYGVGSLCEAAAFLNGTTKIEPTVVNTREEFARASHHFPYDFADVKGQQGVKRAFEVACAGGHNILLVGPPGSGKSMMAKRLPSILPSLSLGEALETTKIHSVAGKLKGGSMLMTARPFRSPHHTISPVAMVGGGSNPAPGEISLAHNGVLFLDEFPEFNRSVLEVMRQPLEDRHITVSRARYTVDYPASFMLVASMNPCPCGYYNHPTKECTCTPAQVQRYLGRISGPLLDRIDLQVEIQPVPFQELQQMEPGEPSEAIRARVERARAVQAQRFAAETSRAASNASASPSQGDAGAPTHCNAQMSPRQLALYARPDAEAMTLLERAMTRFDMSARAYDRILKVARTIADLDASPGVRASHMAEAIGYRNLDRSTWGLK